MREQFGVEQRAMLDTVAAVDAVARAERVDAVFRAGMELARHLYRAAHARTVERGAAGAREFSVDETKIEGGVVRYEQRLAAEFAQLLPARRKRGPGPQHLPQPPGDHTGCGG